MKPNPSSQVLTSQDLNTLSDADLQIILRNLKVRAGKLNGALAAREQEVGNLPNNGAMKFFNRINNEGVNIDRIIYPKFYSVSPASVLKAGQTGKGTFVISSEASFVWTELVKVVFAVDFTDPADPQVEYIDPKSTSGNGDANGLKFALIDSASSRAFMNTHVPLDSFARPNETFKHDRPMMFSSNQMIEVDFVNNNPNVDYVVFLIFKGYAVKTGEIQELVTASL
jgi:hypothetical protein